MSFSMYEVESALKKVKKIDSLAVSIVKNKDVNEAVSFIAEDVVDNILLLSVITKTDPKLATRIAVELKKQFPKEEDLVLRAVSMGTKGGDAYYKTSLNHSLDTVKRLKELKEISEKRKINSAIVGDKTGKMKYTKISESIEADIQKEKETQRQYSRNLDVIKSQQFFAFLFNSLHSPDNDVLSKEELISLCQNGMRWKLHYEYYQYDGYGKRKSLNEEESRKKDERNMGYFLETYILTEPLADGVFQCINSGVLPENIEKLDKKKMQEIVCKIKGNSYDEYICDLYKYLAVKYSEWLMERETPGFDIMNKFLPDRFYLNYKGYDTNYRENARAIFEELKTSEEIQKWMESFDKIPLDEFLGKVPGLKGINVDDSTSQIFVPAHAALKYAKCREKYFPHQSVEECLNKSSHNTYPPEDSYSYRSLDFMAVVYALNKVVNSENPQHDKQNTQIVSRDDGGR